ncbi:MAG: DUF92 domain-containing protein [Calditrichaeota bacterium]|nr:MAG: DUF92 domain-containing protein [Calditrichota bacterium]
MKSFSHLFLKPPASDWLNLLVLFAVIFILILLSEIIRKKLKWRQEVTRKIVHISVGLLLLLTPLLLETSLPLLSIALFFTVFNYVALKKNLLPGIHIDRHNLGTVYYAFSFFLLILLFWENYKIVIIASMMVMAVGDASAAIIGQNIKSPHRYQLIQDTKSLEGSLVMFLVSALAIFMTFILYPPNLATSNHTIFYLFMFSVAAAIIATAAESLGHRGNDNLSVPVITAVVLYFLLSGGRGEHLLFFTGMILGAIAAFLSYRARFLNSSGAVSMFVLATVIFGFGGISWTVPILTFFILSSVLSKVGKSSHEDLFEKGSRRDFTQVMANGGIAGMLMIIYLFAPSPLLYLAYLGALAAAMADTWATEIGMRIGQQPYLISNFQPVPKGTSGGITPAGLSGALLGSMILVASGVPFMQHFQNARILDIFFIVTLAGFLGSVVDSLLGATFQVQFRCGICGKMTERMVHCGNERTVMVKGLYWMDNDLVNFLNTISGAIFSLVGLRILI